MRRMIKWMAVICLTVAGCSGRAGDGVHGSWQERMQGWFAIGEEQEGQGALHKAVICYDKSLDAALRCQDMQAAGYIHKRLAHIYNSCGEYVPAARHLYDAVMAYNGAGMGQEAREALLQYGQAWYNLEDGAKAEQIFKATLSQAHASADTLTEVNALRSYAQLLLQKDTPEPEAAIDMLARAADDLHWPLTSTDQGNLAYAYALLGLDQQAAERIHLAMSQAETVAERNQACFRQYQVAAHAGRSDEALSALEQVVRYGDAQNLAAMKKAVSLAREDYLESQAALSGEKLRSSRLGLLALLLLLVAAVSTAMWYLRARKLEIQKAREETARYIGIAEELRARLAQSSRILKGTMEGKNEILERLCEQYYIYGDSDKLPASLLKEAKSAIEALRDDPGTLAGFEKSVNAARDAAVDRLRAQLPRCKDEDVKLFVLAASGLSRTAMATIMGKEKGVINNRLWRLKGRISDSSAPDRELLLECLGE